MPVEKVIKRHGMVEKFKPEKLTHSVRKACLLSREKVCPPGKIANEVIAHLHRKGKKAVTEEEILDTVGRVLKKNRMSKAYGYYTFAWLHENPSRIRKVQKRNGKMEPFSPVKIYKSIEKSFWHAHQANPRAIDFEKLKAYTREAISTLERRYPGKTVPVAGIRETVEYVLTRHKMSKQAKYYLMHRYM